MLALGIVIIIAAIIGLIFLPICSGSTQAFTDIIIENVSLSGLNKSGELSLFWGITLGGIILLTLLYMLFLTISQKTKLSETLLFSQAKQDHLIEKYQPAYLLWLLIPFAGYLFAYGQLSVPLFCGIVIYFCCLFYKKISFVPTLFTYILTYYALMSILSIGCRFTTHMQLSKNTIYLITLIIATALLVLPRLLFTKQKVALYQNRILGILQCILPGLIAVFCVDRYLYNGSVIKVPYAVGYYIFYIAIAIVALIYAAWFVYKNWSDIRVDFICTSTPILIFLYHTFCASPMYAQPDQHHHGEQMIPWNQIFEHGQTLYDTYTPVSGLFPFLNGFVQHVLLNGTITDYAPAISITMAIICIITMYLIYKHTNGLYAVMFAVLFTLPCYNRQYLVLPILLLLTLPAVMKRPLVWFLAYISTSFLAGLYYPLFGAAVLIGLLPLAATIIYDLIRNRNLIKSDKKVLVIVSYIVLFALIALSCPLLFRMLKHTLTYSSQTIMADGITIFNQIAPDSFLPYLANHTKLHQYLYLAIRFILPALGIWLFALYTITSIRKKAITNIAIGLSGAITLAISYTYTLVRADTGKVLSRTAPILCAIVGIYLVIVLLQTKNNCILPLSRIVLCGFSLMLPLILYSKVSDTKNPDLWVYPDGESQMIMDDADKLFSYYKVPETFLKSEDTGLPAQYQSLLGSGFMVSDQLHYITDYAKVTEKCKQVSEDVSFLAFDGQGFFDYLGVKCYGTGYIPAARSYAAQKEIWDSNPQNRPVVFFIQPEFDYYIFRFMMDEGYIYSHEDQAFYPKDLYQALNESARLSLAEVNQQRDIFENGLGDDYRADVSVFDFALSPSSFGKSYQSLIQAQTIESKENLSDLITQSFDGGTYDAIYIDFDSLEMQNRTECELSSLRIEITWHNSENIDFEGNRAVCSYGKGKLLIPVGMNPCWSMSEISDFDITVYDDTHDIYHATYQSGVSDIPAGAQIIMNSIKTDR